MNRTFKSVFLFLVAVLIFNGCATRSYSISYRNCYRILVDTSFDGDKVPVLRPGESLELKASMVDPTGKEIDFLPVWETDTGVIKPDKGKKVIYTASEIAQPGIAFITVSAGDLIETIIIEIQN